MTGYDVLWRLVYKVKLFIFDYFMKISETGFRSDPSIWHRLIRSSEG